ncbi:HTH-type transcriptional regulator MalT [compost metagenome]
MLARLAQALQRPRPAGDAQSALGELLGDGAQPLWIVLDDYPRQPCAELDQCLDRLFEQSPPKLRWWIGGRRRPAWSLPRLLLQGELLELDAQDLAFDDAELQDLLHEQHLEVPADLKRRLQHECEGWAAGLCLLLFKTDVAGLRERLAAGTPLLQEYIEREVLDALPPPLLRALRLLAHIPRFSAGLCEELLEEAGAELLGELQERQLFLRALDSSGIWFRLWRPLALILKRQPDSLLTKAHLRACRWFFQHGEVREAVEHALWAEQPEVAASYLQRFGQEQLLVEHSVTQFLQWHDELPRSLFASTPRLTTLLGWALLICSRLDEVDACLADLGRFLPQADVHRQRQLLAQWQALQGVLQRQRGLPGARQHCREALAALSESAWSQRILCYQSLTQQAMAEGDLQAAQRDCDEGQRLARLNGSLVYESLLDIERAQLLALRGEFERATEQTEMALEQVAPALRHGPVIARLHLVRGGLLAAQGHVEEARAAYRQGMQEAERCEDACRLFGYLGLAELASDGAQVVQLLREAERLLHWQHVSEARYFGVLQFANGLLHLHGGDLASARERFETLLDSYRQHHLLAPSGLYDLLPRARLGLALCDLREGRLEAAQAALRGLREESLQQGLLPLACECRFGLVEALLAAGRHGQAEAELHRALHDAQRMQLFSSVRNFYRRQPELVLRHASAAQRERLQDQPLALEAGHRAGSLLSSRELAVLTLIAQGLSNQEIAERLFISLHTVKTHARRINGKLKVARRTQAVAQAKALGLLGEADSV